MPRLGSPMAATSAAGEVAPARPSASNGLKEAFVDYYSDGLHTVAILEFAGEKPRYYPIPADPAQVGEAVVALRRSFDRSKYRPGIDPERPGSVDLTFIDEIGRKLLPFLDDLKQADLVCFFPHGPLHNFPFHIVRDAAGEPLIRRVAVAYCPSRKVLTIMRDEQGASGAGPLRPKTALVVGVPAAGEREPEMFYGDGEFLTSLGLKVKALEGPAHGTVSKVVRHMK